MNDFFASQLLRWRYLTSFILLSITALLSISMGSFGFNADFRIFFDDDDALLVAYESMEKEFTQSYTQIFILQTKKDDLFTPKRLAAIQWLNDRVWRLPHASRVLSIANHQHTSASNDDLWVEDLFDEPLTYSEKEITRIKKIVLNEPELKNYLVNGDGNVALVIAMLNIDKNEQGEKLNIMEESRKLIAEFRKSYPDIKIQIGGQLTVEASMVEIAEKDAAQVELLMICCLLLLLAFFLRSIAAIFAGFVIMLVSVIAATGFLGLVYTDFNAINLSAPYIVYMMAILDCVHIISAYFSRLTKGIDKYQAMHESLSKNIEALLITSLTTAVGFAAMNFADSPPFREFGNGTAFGVIFAFLASVSLLPSIMLLLPAKKSKIPPANKLVQLSQYWFKRYSHRYLPIGWLLIAIMIPAAMLNTPNHHLMSAFRTDAPARVATDFLEKEKMGTDLIDFSLHAKEPGGIVEPKFLTAIDEFTQWLEKQPEVLKVNGFHNVIKRLNKTMHGDDSNYYRIPDDRKAVAEYLLVYESNVPEELDLQDNVNIDKSALRISAKLKTLSSSDILAFNQRAIDKLTTFKPIIANYKSSSQSLMMGYVAQSNIYSMLKGCLFVAVFVCISMMVAFRSINLGLLCMVPNLLPSIIAFGLCGLFVGEIDLGAAMIFSITLGIVVDDTIHFVVSYRRLRQQQHLSPIDAINETYSLVGRAIIITTLVLCIGYMIPVFMAELRMNTQMYGLSIICIGVAMIVDLFFLPALLMKTDKNP